MHDCDWNTSQSSVAAIVVRLLSFFHVSCNFPHVKSPIRSWDKGNFDPINGCHWFLRFVSWCTGLFLTLQCAHCRRYSGVEILKATEYELTALSRNFNRLRGDIGICMDYRLTLATKVGWVNCNCRSPKLNVAHHLKLRCVVSLYKIRCSCKVTSPNIWWLPFRFALWKVARLHHGNNRSFLNYPPMHAYTCLLIHSVHRACVTNTPCKLGENEAACPM